MKSSNIIQHPILHLYLTPRSKTPLVDVPWPLHPHQSLPALWRLSPDEFWWALLDQRTIKGNISVKSEWFLVSHYIPLLLLFKHQTSRDVFDSLTSCLRGIWTCQHHLLVNFWMGSCSVRLSNNITRTNHFNECFTSIWFPSSIGSER